MNATSRVYVCTSLTQNVKTDLDPSDVNVNKDSRGPPTGVKVSIMLLNLSQYPLVKFQTGWD